MRRGRWHSPASVALLAVSTAVFAWIFWMGRRYFLVDVPIAAVHPDSYSYYAVTREMQQGYWPSFRDRAPLLPIVMLVLFWIKNKVWSLVVFQNVFAAGSGIFAVCCFWRVRPWLAPWVG